MAEVAPKAVQGSSAQQVAPSSPPKPVSCYHCKKVFYDYNDLVEHMGREYERSNWLSHHHCLDCKRPFPTFDALDLHTRTNHAQYQTKLDCPACRKRFVRATDLVRHIEQKECPVIDTEKLDEAREKKLWFARELQARHFGDYDEAAEAPLMSRNAALRPKAEATVRPYPVQFEVYESENHDVYSYYQNVIQSRAINSGNVNAKQSGAQKALPARLAIASPAEAEPSQQTDPTTPRRRNPGNAHQDDIKEASQDKTGLSLLEDFVPAEQPNLQISLFDYLDSGHRGLPGSDDTWGAFFNPWQNDDLAGMSKAASRSQSPDDSQTSTPKRSAPIAPTKTSQALTPTKTPKSEVSIVKTGEAATRPQASQALTPVKTVATIPRNSTALAPRQTNNEPPMADFDEVKKSFANFAALHNPQNPGFRVQQYWEPLIAKYKCPMPSCFKSFKKPGQFTHHMGTHMQDKKCFYPCPGCKNMFETLAALIAHTESQSTRCKFRHSKTYGVFMAQALAGIVDVVGEDMERSTVEFATSSEAKKMFGGESLDKGPRASRSAEFKPATAALEEAAADSKEDQKKKFWEEHERMIEKQKAMEAEEERVRRKKTEIEKQIRDQQAKAAEAERAKQAQLERERKMKEQQAREIEAGRVKKARLEQERVAMAQKARETEAERVKQAKMAHERKIEEQQEEERKAMEAQWLQRDIKQERGSGSWEEIKEEPDVDGWQNDEEIKELERQEREYLQGLAKIKEAQQKIKAEKEKRAKEEKRAREEQLARQTQEAQRQVKEETKTYNVTKTDSRFNWW